MVERLFLPERTPPTEASIDLCRREVQPGVALTTDAGSFAKRNETVEMIGHDHDVPHPISIAIEVQEGLHDQVRDGGIPKPAFAVTSIQFSFSFATKLAVEFDSGPRIE